MSTCAFYPEAHAMILGEDGVMEFSFDGEKGWQLVMNVRVKKKIFHTAGKDVANVTIRLYDPPNTNNREYLLGLSGVTYNLVNGKVEKSRLKNSDKYETRVNDYWTEVGFTFPDVQEGSIIEYDYKIVSDFLLNLPTWRFQYDIPVQYSMLQYTIPEYFNYQVNQLGQGVSLNDKQEGFTQVFRYKWEQMTPGKAVERGEDQFEVYCNRRVLTGTNILPLEEEPYVANTVDLPGRIEFQLISFDRPGETRQNFADSYETFNKRLLQDEKFGLKLDHGKFAEELLSPAEGKTQEEIASLLLEKLQRHFAWNETFSYISENAGNKAFREKSGTAADINLSLVAAYRQFGLQAFPVILSTRGHGTPHPSYPNFEDFNYVIAAVSIGEQLRFADATSDMPFGSLPSRCLNGKGWLVSETGGWVDLKTDAASSRVTFIEGTLDDRQLKCTMKVMEKGYASFDSKASFEQDGAETFSKNLAGDLGEWSIGQLAFDGETTAGTTRYELAMSKEVEDGDVIYLSPIAYGAFGKNPFTRATRSSVVDFPYGLACKVIYILTVPEGYTVELPQTEKILLFDDKALFSYQPIFDETKRSLRVISDFRLQETCFSSDQYAFLREFFQRMQDKNEEWIILKKL